MNVSFVDLDKVNILLFIVYLFRIPVVTLFNRKADIYQYDQFCNFKHMKILTLPSLSRYAELVCGLSLYQHSQTNQYNLTFLLYAVSALVDARPVVQALRCKFTQQRVFGFESHRKIWWYIGCRRGTLLVIRGIVCVLELCQVAASYWEALMRDRISPQYQSKRCYLIACFLFCILGLPLGIPISAVVYKIPNLNMSTHNSWTNAFGILALLQEWIDCCDEFVRCFPSLFDQFILSARM